MSRQGVVVTPTEHQFHTLQTPRQQLNDFKKRRPNLIVQMKQAPQSSKLRQPPRFVDQGNSRVRSHPARVEAGARMRKQFPYSFATAEPPKLRDTEWNNSLGRRFDGLSEKN